MKPPLDVTDPTFIRDLRASKPSVARVALALWSGGHTVTLPAVHERPDETAIAEFGDAGDLHVLQRIEVKHRPALHFTTREDLTRICGGDGLTIDSVRKWQRADPKPYAYVICNGSLTHAAIVLSASFAAWTLYHPDAFRRAQPHYRCPLTHVHVVSLAHGLRVAAIPPRGGGVAERSPPR